MLTPTPSNLDCNSPPFLIKIKRQAKNHLHISMLLRMWQQKRDAWQILVWLKSPFNYGAGDTNFVHRNQTTDLFLTNSRCWRQSIGAWTQIKLQLMMRYFQRLSQSSGYYFTSRCSYCDVNRPGVYDMLQAVLLRWHRRWWHGREWRRRCSSLVNGYWDHKIVGCHLHCKIILYIYKKKDP